MTTTWFEKIGAFRDNPATFQETAHRQHALDTSKRAFFDGKVNMMKDVHSSVADLKTTMSYELYGYAAIANPVTLTIGNNTVTNTGNKSVTAAIILPKPLKGLFINPFGQ